MTMTYNMMVIDNRLMIFKGSIIITTMQFQLFTYSYVKI